MLNDAPAFWWRQAGWQAFGLWPISAVYGLVSARRMRKGLRTKVDAPVLCIGNFTVGGTGKTPTAIAFAERARALGLVPGILSRGHGGSRMQPTIVDAERDRADDVGDEPLLLAKHAVVAVGRDRQAAAEMLIGRGCDFLIMDDGLQSAHIHMDYALAIVDARHGVGNGHVIPGGPLRAPMSEQVKHVAGLLVMGRGQAAHPIVRMISRAAKPIFEAELRPLNPGALRGRQFLAFAGIGHPQRFFDAITVAGGQVALRRSFGDHHAFQLHELAELESRAHKANLELITTAKDAVRLRHREVPPLFRSKLNVLEIETAFDDPDASSGVIEQTVAAYKVRKRIR